ncbi:hypothetical protein [Sphingobium sp. CCH11-B1]|jgi:hypothetical protein|uniref:hypothetical protein n=1 Tax=Sphingobium sp. CCH11-B1 TaxID=1768781 RepID=UPI0008329694|nr:hypothetical protein [Sphingobium sp. CCH11-B1]
MTSYLRTITHGLLEWRGLLVQITYEQQQWVDHIQIETVEPIRAPLPITETGYRSNFIAKGLVDEAGGAGAFVESWLNRAAVDRTWADTEVLVRQYSLL